MRNRKLRFLYGLLIIMGCNNPKTSNNVSDNLNKQNISGGQQDLFADTLTFPRVYLAANEIIWLNGRQVSISELDNTFKDVLNRKGIIFLSYINATEDPPKEGDVINLIKRYQVPIKMFTDSSFLKSFN